MTKISRKDIIVTLVVFLIFLFQTLVMLSWLIDTPISTAINVVLVKLYRPHFNIFEVHLIGSIHPLKILYIILSLTVATLVLSYRILLPNHFIKKIPKIIFLTYLLGILTIGAGNFIMRIKHFMHDFKLYHGKSLDQRNLLLNKDPFFFVEKAQEVLTGRHQGKIITNEIINEEPHITTHRILSYYLYPIISLRLDNKSPNDILIYYKNKSSLDSVPDDQEILTITNTNDYDFILTINKATSQDDNNP